MVDNAKVDDEEKGLMLSRIFAPLIKLSYGSVLLVVAAAFIMAVIVGAIGFLIWAIFNPRQAPAKLQEIKMSLDDFWHITKTKLRGE